ncbi:MAG: hypothetical protein ABSG43_06720 [Solirubrobacteraceae bacterium]
MAIAQLRRRGEMDRVWVLSALTLAGAAALYAGPVRGLAPLARPHLPWWLLAVAFAAGESAAVHLHFRRGAQTFSLGDFPLVFGLIFCSGRGVVVACLLGSGVALRIDRKLPWFEQIRDEPEDRRGRHRRPARAHVLAVDHAARAHRRDRAGRRELGDDVGAGRVHSRRGVQTRSRARSKTRPLGRASSRRSTP